MEALVLAAAWATVIANAVATIFVGIQVRQMALGLSQSRMQSQHSLCLEIWKHYNDAFSDRQSLLENPVRLEDVRKKYTSSDEIFNSDEYKKLRRVASVYGMAASLVKTGAIEPGIIFNYISVPPRLWEAHRPFIDYVRREHYSSLFVGWEELNASEFNIWSPNGAREQVLEVEAMPHIEPSASASPVQTTAS